MLKVLTEVRSAQRKLTPDTVGLEFRKHTSLRGIANTVKRVMLAVKGNEYNRRTGCEKTARPSLYGGRRVTYVPTLTSL